MNIGEMTPFEMHIGEMTKPLSDIFNLILFKYAKAIILKQLRRI